MSDFIANCSATAIGSFPHPDPGAAFKLISKTLPEVPCWPQLPKRGIQEEMRSEEHTSELQSQSNLVCRLLPEKIISLPSSFTLTSMSLLLDSFPLPRPA